MHSSGTKQRRLERKAESRVGRTRLEVDVMDPKNAANEMAKEKCNGVRQFATSC